MSQEKMVQIPRRFFGEMSDDEFHDFLHKQNGCLTKKQLERVYELIKQDESNPK